MLRKGWTLGIAVAGLCAGCRESGVQSCLDLNTQQKYEAAAERCSAVFAGEGDPKAGAAVVKAHYSLGHEDEVLSWVDRLAKQGKAAPGVWVLAGAVQEKRGELESADQAYRRDLELSRAAQEGPRVADVLVRLSRVSWGRSRHREAFLFASEAIQEAVKAQDKDLELRAANALYTVLYAVGDLAGARRALEASGALADGEDRARQARFLANRGGLLADEGRLALARRDLDKALELGADSANPWFFRAAHLNLTNVYLELGDIGRAAHHLEEARKHAEPGKPPPTSLSYYRARVDLARGQPAAAVSELADALSRDPEPDWAWDLEYQLGRAEEAQGHLDAAAAAYERSIGIIENMRRELAFDDLKAWLLNRKRQPFEALFLLQARLGRAEAALATVERAQARTFLDAFLNTSSPAAPEGSKPWSTNSLERIEGLESLLPVMSESPVAALQPIGQVLSSFDGRDGLVYFEAGDRLWLITVSGRRVRLRATNPAATVRRLASRFLAHPEDTRIAASLGEMLMPPGSLPVKGRTLHIVADGILGNVPFAALHRGGKYLIEDYAIVLVPSLSALAALENRPADAFLPPLVLADPKGNLPAARVEGLKVAKLLNSSALTAGQAVSDALKRAAHTRTLHLATHSGLGPRGAWLQLADRQVSASEIVAGRIGPRLVVLASCSSAVRPGREIWGSIGAAFLAAGSRAVLATLTAVNDRSARDFVLRFYEEGGASEPAAALARAQRVAIGQGQSPTGWAPFVLLGSGRPLQ